MARGSADITSLALGNARRISELERFHELVETLDAGFWEAGRRLADVHVHGRTRRRAPRASTPARGRPKAGRGATTSPRRTAEALMTLHAAAEAGRDGSVEYRVERPGRDSGMDPRPRPRGPWRAGAAPAPRAHGGRHGAQARGTRPAAERAQVLGGVPPRARGVATPPSARRHEEHVPRGRVARPPNAAHVDPGIRADAGAVAVRAPPRGRGRPRAPHRRRTRGSSSACCPTSSTSTGSNAASSRRSGARPTSSSSCVGRRGDREPRRPPDRGGRGTPSPSRSMARRWSASSRTSCRTRSGTRRPRPRSGCARAARTAACCSWSRTRARASPDLHEAVFEPFRQAPGSAAEHSPGVGVGLSLVLRFAELHGGRAWMEDRPGGGARFSVFLPGG